MARFGALRFTALLLALAGCGQADLPGHYWDLSASTQVDGCNSPAVQYSEDFEYRLVIDVTDIEVAIGPDTFAVGTIDGCTVSYDSIVWTEPRDAGDIQWTLSGTATAQRGNGACGISTDWIGTETFTVLSSDDPTVSPGCEYVLDLVGSYAGEVQ
ncbi:MAG: hypothetical protein R3F61_05990 [Myxococcota bacterium]